MKNDLDVLMQSHNIDALLIVGSGKHNPAMSYFTGGAPLGQAYIIVVNGRTPILFHRDMERDEAAKTGLDTRRIENYHIDKIFKEVHGDMRLALAELLKRMFVDLGLTSGRVVVSGKDDIGTSLSVFSAFKEIMPDIELIGEIDQSILNAARATKDAHEIERIRKMGQITTDVVGLTADFLSSHTAVDGKLIKHGGVPLTIGEVKDKINLWLAERGAENPEGTIFASGRDATVPHSTGNREQVLHLGETIIFDLFPCEAGGGYFFDLTRTWCLGYAPQEVQAVYEDVKAVYQQVMEELKLGAPFKDYQLRTCELFEGLGHPTILKDQDTQEGYVHGLGHGVGLEVHEKPWSRVTGNDCLDAGSVITIEPGLYYPDRGLGVRLEDTVWIRADGVVELLADYPHDLVLPVRTN